MYQYIDDLASPMDLKSKTDTELVKIALKNPDAFTELVERYESKLSRYVCRLVSVGKDESRDILQEIFIKVYRNLNAFDSDLKFSSWIYRIAHNESLNYVKKNIKHKKEIKNEEDFVQLIDLLASDIDVLKDFKKKELRENISTLLNDLPIDYKEVLVLFYMEDKSYQEISDILKKPVGTVGTLLNRAKDKFKSVLQNSTLFNY